MLFCLCYSIYSLRVFTNKFDVSLLKWVFQFDRIIIKCSSLCAWFIQLHSNRKNYYSSQKCQIQYANTFEKISIGGEPYNFEMCVVHWIAIFLCLIWPTAFQYREPSTVNHHLSFIKVYNTFSQFHLFGKFHWEFFELVRVICFLSTFHSFFSSFWVYSFFEWAFIFLKCNYILILIAFLVIVVRSNY